MTSAATTSMVIAKVITKHRQEFPGGRQDLEDAVWSQASELLSWAFEQRAFTNVDALVAWVMVEIRLSHQSGIARPTPRQTDMRRRDAWEALMASQDTSTTTKENADA